MYLYTIIPSYQHLYVFTVDATWALVLMEQKKEKQRKIKIKKKKRFNYSANYSAK